MPFQRKNVRGLYVWILFWCSSEKFEWDKFDDVFKLVSGLIETLWYCVFSFVLYRSAVFFKSVSLGSFSLSDVFRWCV